MLLFCNVVVHWSVVFEYVNGYFVSLFSIAYMDHHRNKLHDRKTTRYMYAFLRQESPNLLIGYFVMTSKDMWSTDNSNTLFELFPSLFELFPMQHKSNCENKERNQVPQIVSLGASNAKNKHDYCLLLTRDYMLCEKNVTNILLNY